MVHYKSRLMTIRIPITGATIKGQIIPILQVSNNISHAKMCEEKKVAYIRVIGQYSITYILSSVASIHISSLDL